MALSKKRGTFTPTDPHREASGKAGGGSSVCVKLLDGTVLTYSLVDKKMLGQSVFDQVLRKLDLLERDYFGLLYEDDHKTMQWLDLLKPIKKQLKKQPYTMYFRVRFYAVDPLSLHRNSKEQFYLQLKEDIRVGRLPFPSESAHSILSYVLQADVGDYQSNQEDLHYLQENGLLILGKDRTAESSIIKLHKLLKGKEPGIAVEKFLRKTRELDSYGAKFNLIRYEGIPYRMGMSPSGIGLYQDGNRTTHFSWRKILQVSYKQKRFTLRIKSRSSESGEKTVVLDVESSKVCKEMWEQCVERVSFYNEHTTRRKERGTSEAAGSRSPSPPITRDYATINDATPHLEGARESSLQSSPAHNEEQQHEHSPQREDGTHTNGGANHVGGGSMDVEGQMKDSQEHILPQSVMENGVRERSKERVSSEERDDDTLKRRSKIQSKGQSLPRKLPTGDPMLHHMMQFQNLERPSRGTPFSESDSTVETTSPIVSTCDEASESPELMVLGHQSLNTRELGHLAEGHMRSFSLPQPQTEQFHPERQARQTIHRWTVTEGRMKHRREMETQETPHAGLEENSESVHELSISSSKETGDDSMHDSLEELADLLGEEEVLHPEKKERNSRKEETEHRVSQEREIKQSPPQTRAARDEQEKTRRQKQLQKQILLQRQQIKEQKLQQYLEKQKQKQHKESATRDPVESQERHTKYTHSSQQSKSQPRDVRSRERGQRSLKANLHQSDQGASSLSRHHSDSGKEQSLRERKIEERDMVRYWAKEQRKKSHKDSRSPPSGTKSQHVRHSPSHAVDNRLTPVTDNVNVRMKQEGQLHPAQPDTPTHNASGPSSSLSSPFRASYQGPAQHKQSYPPDEHIYNTLAPKQDNSDPAVAETQKSLENLPSSPPPPPYKSPSPPHQASVTLKQGHLHENDIDSPVELGPRGAGNQIQSLTSSHGTPSTSTPPTPSRSRSTLTSHSPQSLGSVNRSPRYTHSFSGGSAGSSPRTPIRTQSMKSGQYSPAKQSPSLVPRRDKDYGKQVSSAAKPDASRLLQPNQPSMHKASDVLDNLVTPIKIDPSALQKEDLTINPHNFLKEDSPAYDTLLQSDEEDNVVSVTSLPKKQPSPHSGTHYNLETALQEVMTSENLPPPPTHLLEISEQLEDIDYQELDALPHAGSMKASRADFDLLQNQQQQQQQQQKKVINPEMIAKSIDVPRSTTNPNFYPPHIAKFMSRVRSSSIDSNDPTTQAKDFGNHHSVSDNAKNDGANADIVRADIVMPPSQQQAHVSLKSDLRPNQHYDVPRTALGKTLSLESANKQLSHPVTAGSNPRSDVSTGRVQAPKTSYSLPRGPSTLQRFASETSEDTAPLSPHAHSDHGASVERKQQDRLHKKQRPTSAYTQNGARARQSASYGDRGADSIPNSPTFFTHNHPHKDDPTPSLEAQLINQSFQDHLNSLQSSRPSTRGTNVVNWMQQSTSYWNSNKSVPKIKGAPSSVRPLQSPKRMLTPTLSSNLPSKHPAVTKPIVHSHQQQTAPQHKAWPTSSLSRAPPQPFGSIPLSASCTSLRGKTSGPPPQSLPLNLPTSTDNYYVLDV